MVDFSVTLESLREAGACISGYNKVVRALQCKPFSDEDNERNSYIRFAHKEPVPLISILESNGLDDALWALRCVHNVDRDARLFAVWCARQVQHLMPDPRSLAALDVAERFANGMATENDLAAAWAAAWAAERDAARAAARAAARDAARDAARAAQKAMFICMCNGSAPWQEGV